MCDGHGHWSPVAVKIRNFLSIESEGKKPENLNVRVDKVRKGHENGRSVAANCRFRARSLPVVCSADRRAGRGGRG